MTSTRSISRGHLAQTPKGNGDPARIGCHRAGRRRGPPGPDAERQWRPLRPSPARDDAAPSWATWPRRRKAMETEVCPGGGDSPGGWGHLAQTPKGNGDGVTPPVGVLFCRGPPGPDAERQWRHQGHPRALPPHDTRGPPGPDAERQWRLRRRVGLGLLGGAGGPPGPDAERQWRPRAGDTWCAG